VILRPLLLAIVISGIPAAVGLDTVGAQMPATSADAGQVERGRRLFAEIGCYQCHGREGQGSTQTGGSRIGPPVGRQPAFVAYIRRPTRSMPPYTEKVVSDSELGAIYAFLETKTVRPVREIPLLQR
jgi:mono/diheme cytochrome c family protein